ncbi:Hypothetical predicted protein [Podarcis lilfordi]|uniref:Uncharacterized protein n=1 Tax=Podarcis lilfordi TaxID=74358 RepID=A0AA35PJ63_9SAUR|nr:Hypothetical predicted protein [Podarcis lilfordi]
MVEGKGEGAVKGRNCRHHLRSLGERDGEEEAGKGDCSAWGGGGEKSGGKESLPSLPLRSSAWLFLDCNSSKGNVCEQLAGCSLREGRKRIERENVALAMLWMDTEDGILHEDSEESDVSDCEQLSFINSDFSSDEFLGFTED